MANTRTYPRLILRTQTHIHLIAYLFLALPRAPLHTHTQVAVYLRFGWWWHTHPYPYWHLIARANTRSSFTLTVVFPLHACTVSRNLRTYFTMVGRVFLVETVVLQTVLWDIRACNTCFLVGNLATWKISPAEILPYRKLVSRILSTWKSR